MNLFVDGCKSVVNRKKCLFYLSPYWFMNHTSDTQMTQTRSAEHCCHPMITLHNESFPSSSTVSCSYRIPYITTVLPFPSELLSLSCHTLLKWGHKFILGFSFFNTHTNILIDSVSCTEPMLNIKLHFSHLIQERQGDNTHKRSKV